MKLRLVALCLGFVLACGGRTSHQYPMRGVGGGSGVRLVFTGPLTGEALAVGADREHLETEVGFPVSYTQCPGASLAWQRAKGVDLDRWNLVGCSTDTLVWQGSVGEGAKIKSLEFDFQHVTDSLYIVVKLDTAPFVATARVPMPAPEALAGSITTQVRWTGSADNDQPVELGVGKLMFTWEFDPEVSREWMGRRRR